MSEVFKELYEIDVNSKTENKNGLSYLSWAWAWAEVKKRYPDATYEVKWFDDHENKSPYYLDHRLGILVFTEVTIDGQTLEMWLPVMDYNNHSMKLEPYQLKYSKKTVNVGAATMTDINKAIMRCLTKNLAMFGLGLYIYAGEDLPEQPEPKIELITEEDVQAIREKVKDLSELSDGDVKENAEKTTRWIKRKANVQEIKDIPKNFLNDLLGALDRMMAKAESEQQKDEESGQTSLMDGNTTTAKENTDD